MHTVLHHCGPLSSTHICGALVHHPSFLPGALGADLQLQLPRVRLWPIHQPSSSRRRRWRRRSDRRAAEAMRRRSNLLENRHRSGVPPHWRRRRRVMRDPGTARRGVRKGCGGASEGLDEAATGVWGARGSVRGGRVGRGVCWTFSVKICRARGVC